MAFHQVHIQPSPSTTWYHVHSTPQSQLHFNLDPTKTSIRNHFEKPKPIIIEKLLPYPQLHMPSQKIEGKIPCPSTILSSDRLAFAMQLAKMDVNRIKNMISEPDIVPIVSEERTSKSKREDNKIKKHKRTSEQEETRRKPKTYTFNLYPQEIAKQTQEPIKRAEVNPPVTHLLSKEDREVVRLQEDLLNFSSTLDQVVKKLHHQQQSINPVNLNDEETVTQKERNVLRATEQKSRSARMLYMLHHKIREVEKQKSKINNGIRPTRKSEYRTSLASAQRAAVRALQMFVNHAPLFFNTAGKLPDTYKELGSLVQQLTMLSTVSSEGKSNDALKIIEDLIASLGQATKVPSESSRLDKKSKIVKISHSKPSSKRAGVLEKHIKWLKKKADELNLKSFEEEEEEEATPERVSTLKHAYNAMNNIKNKEQEPEQRERIKTLAIKEPKKKSKSGVLLPKHVKNRRLIPPTRPYHVSPSGNMNYAAPTVLSKIREKPPVEKSPPTTPKKVKNTNAQPLTPKQRDEMIINEAKFLQSPRQTSPMATRSSAQSPVCSPPRSYPCIAERYYNGSSLSSSFRSENSSMAPPTSSYPFVEKEISRQNWLDRLKTNEMRRLEKMGRINTREYKALRKEFGVSHHLVQAAEAEIRDKLQPLLEKAEMIAKEEAKKEEEYNTSIKKRLADMSSQRALSEGERLADYILDDMLMEAAIDFQRIEAENLALSSAAFQFDRPTLESIEERLKTFENEEEKIRRYWKSCNYADINLKQSEKIGEEPSRVVMFTALSEKRKPLPPTPVIDEDQTSDTSEHHIPTSTMESIEMHREKFQKYVDKLQKEMGIADRDKLLNEISEELLDDLLHDVTEELNDNCDDFVDQIYEKEFLHSAT